MERSPGSLPAVEPVPQMIEGRDDASERLAGGRRTGDGPLPGEGDGGPERDVAEDVTIVLRVDGRDRSSTVPADRLLIDLLRYDLGLTGTKEGCGVGVCGACSVLVDGRLLSSCIVLAASVNGAEITTVEGLARPDGSLSPLQAAFIEHGGFQCGICTPGQLVAATALLLANASPSEGDVRDWMKGNLCRCTGYRAIVDSILDAASAEGVVAAEAALADAPVEQ